LRKVLKTDLSLGKLIIWNCDKLSFPHSLSSW
jgi:hypothetical protein